MRNKDGSGGVGAKHESELAREEMRVRQTDAKGMQVGRMTQFQPYQKNAGTLGTSVLADAVNFPIHDSTAIDRNQITSHQRR